MSFIDADQGRRTRPIVAVAALHALIAYGFISGLAYRVIPYVDLPTVVNDYRDDAPPPPLPKELPSPRREVDRPRDAAPDRVIDVPTLGGDVIVVPTLGVSDIRQPDQPPLTQTPPARASEARAPGVIGDRAAWVTADDYPSAALRQGVEGIVGIGLTIGTDGRVAACEVTATSGNALLDQATCRTYARRARFTPALDAEGRPVAAHRADRVRWQLPPM